VITFLYVGSSGKCVELCKIKQIYKELGFMGFSTITKNHISKATCMLFPLVGNPSEKYMKETRQPEERFRTDPRQGGDKSWNDKQVSAPLLLKYPHKSLKSPYV